MDYKKGTTRGASGLDPTEYKKDAFWAQEQKRVPYRLCMPASCVGSKAATSAPLHKPEGSFCEQANCLRVDAVVM